MTPSIASLRPYMLEYKLYWFKVSKNEYPQEFLNGCHDPDK